MTATDPDGATGTATVQVVVTGNRAPSVTLTATPASGKSPLKVAFVADGSDPEGGALTYRYNFGDGSKLATGRLQSHTYKKAGTYTAKVTVTDPEGATSSAQLTITATGK